MIRILHLRSSCGLYGADRALLDLAQATLGPLEATVGSIVRGEADPLGEEAARRGLPTLRVQSDGRADLGAARALGERLVAGGFCLVHAHDYKSLALGLLAGRRAGVPVVATFHGDTGATAALVAYEALARALGNLTSGVAAVSAPLARKLRRWVFSAPVCRIPNGIPIPAPCTEQERAAARRELWVPREARVVAVIGRLSVEKGHAVLLDALRSLPRPPVVLVAGEGPLAAALRERAKDLDVRWLGFTSHTRAVYAAADVVALPSLTEGLPLVALEAMALGRPLLASAVGELPSLLADGAGVLVRPNDAGDLARALRRVLEQPALAAGLRERALERVRGDFDVERMAERYARRLYAPALADAQMARPALLRAAEEGLR